MNNLKSIKRIMDKLELTLAIAESLTSGNLQAAIGSISGSSTFYEGGITAYSLRQKVELLGIDHQHAEDVDCISEQVALEMAKGVAERFGADIGLSTTGYAEPNLEKNILHPYAYIAIWRQEKLQKLGGIVTQQLITGEGLNRVQMQKHVTKILLNYLTNYLFEIEKEE